MSITNRPLISSYQKKYKHWTTFNNALNQNTVENLKTANMSLACISAGGRNCQYAVSKLEQFRNGIEKKSPIYVQLTKNLADVCQTLGRVSATIAVDGDNNDKISVEQTANSLAN